MSGNIVDFSKIIRRARDFPDLESWRDADLKTYSEAVKFKVIDRPEVTRHMDINSLKGISYEDVLRDFIHYKTPSSWRRASPLIFWKCYHKGWFTRPEVRAHFSSVRSKFPVKPGMTAPKDAPTSLKHDQHVELFRQQIRAPGVLIDDRIMSGAKSKTIAKTVVQEEIAAGYLKRIAPKLYAKTSLASLVDNDPNKLRIEVARAVLRELNWSVIPNYALMAFDFELEPAKPETIGLNGIDSNSRLNLTGFLGEDELYLKIAKTSMDEFILHATPEGRVLRALQGLHPDDVHDAAMKLTGSMGGVQIKELLRLSRFTPVRIQRTLKRLLK